MSSIHRSDVHLNQGVILDVTPSAETSEPKSSSIRKPSYEESSNGDDSGDVHTEDDVSLFSKHSYAITKEMASGFKFRKVKTAHGPWKRPAWRPTPAVPDHKDFVAPKKGTSWSEYEHNALFLLLVAQRNDEVSGNLSIPPLRDIKLFKKVAGELETYFGVERTESSARCYWNRFGRKQSGYEERFDVRSDSKMVTSAPRLRANRKAASKKVYKRLYQKSS